MNREATDRSPDRRHGFALIAVLWLLAALAIIAVNLLATVRTDYTLDRSALRRAQAEAAAAAGVNIGIAALLQHQAHPPWRLDGSPERSRFGPFRITVSIQDEDGKIDLNAASDGVLRRLFVSLGLNDKRASALAAKIADWRDVDNFKRLHGAEAADYRAAGFPYEPRNGPFESVGELGQVMGMTPALLQRAKPALTVFSHSAHVDLSTAPPEVLRALAPRKSLEVTANLEKKPYRPGTVVVGTTANLPSLVDRAFTVTAEAVDKNGVSATRTEVVRFTSESSYWILGWR